MSTMENSQTGTRKGKPERKKQAERRELSFAYEEVCVHTSMHILFSNSALSEGLEMTLQYQPAHPVPDT